MPGALLQQSEYDWDYDTGEEPFCGGRRLYLPRGKVLGGTSVLNGMVYTRGNPADYDGWRQPGWSFSDLLPYFKRAEDNERGESELHGAGGPLGVSDGRYRSPATAAFVEAAIEAGFAANADFSGSAQEGFGFYQVTGRAGERCSAATAYLRPAIGRPNLTVETRLLVERVFFEDGRAAGVWARANGERFEIRATREVILAAGSYNSPELLMLSGVGPADSLRAAGLPVVADLPMVGQNLQDHPQCWLVFTHSAPVSLAITGDPRHVRQYELDRTGPLSSNGPEAGGFVRTGPARSLTCSSTRSPLALPRTAAPSWARTGSPWHRACSGPAVGAAWRSPQATRPPSRASGTTTSPMAPTWTSWWPA